MNLSTVSAASWCRIITESTKFVKNVSLITKGCVTAAKNCELNTLPSVAAKSGAAEKIRKRNRHTQSRAGTNAAAHTGPIRCIAAADGC